MATNLKGIRYNYSKNIVARFRHAVTVEAIETSKGTQRQKNKCLLVVAG
jgi:hypothetical protein